MKKKCMGIVLAVMFFVPLFSRNVYAGDEKMLVYILPHPTEYLKILPETSPVPGVISDRINMIACRGEYEPASFVIHALSDIKSLKVKAGSLKGKKGVIPSSSIDIRVVKCWYQDRGTGWPSNCMVASGKRVLTPELLLNDDLLVKIDKKNKDNYLKLSYPDKPKYICISKKEGISGMSSFSPTAEQFPVKDSSVLLPVDIPAKTNKQFWLTLKVPESALPGLYTGRIEISASANPVKSLNVCLRVLPVELSSPYYSSSIYYSGGIISGRGRISHLLKSREQYKKDLENLYAHGVTNPTVNENFLPQGFWGIGTNTYNLKMGSNVSYKGAMDEVRIYKKALSAQQISDNYKNLSNKTDSSLIGCWKFDEGKGDTAEDSSGCGNHGKIFGAAWIEGVSGSALQFDGKGDYVNCGESESLRITTGSFTIETWIRTTIPSTGLFFSTRKATSRDSWYGFIVTKGKLRIELSAIYPVYRGVVYGVSTINDGKWHYIAFVRDASDGKVRLFVDGKLDKEAKDPTAGQSLSSDDKVLAEALNIRKEVGMDSRILYCLGEQYQIGKPSDLERLKKEVKEVIKFTKPYGIEEVYFYGIDEAMGEKLKSQRPAWQAVREAGGKVFVAGCQQRNEHGGSTLFESVGDLLNLFICSGYPDREEARKCHSVGHKIGCYGYPQGGVENPEIYRRNFGLLLWKYNYDVALTCTYQGGNFGGWSEFFNGKYRPHMMAYPTVDGAIDTIQWEGYREGVDDVRYLTTLLKAIEKAKTSKDKATMETVLSAERYLSSLDVENRNLDTIRLEIISYILKLQKGTR